MEISQDQALSAYFFSLQLESSIQVCAGAVPGYQGEFERRYAAWRALNAATLAAGETFAMARGMDGPNPPSMRHAAKLTAGLLESMPEDDRSRRCNEFLAELPRLPVAPTGSRNE